MAHSQPDRGSTSPTSYAEIDLSRLAHNYNEVRRLSGQRKLIAAIKADAYGFGAPKIGLELEKLGVDALWSGDLREAVDLRTSGLNTPVYMFGGPLGFDFSTMIDHRITPTVHDETSYRAVEREARSRGESVPVYVKVDCGLGRLGVPLSGAFDFISRLAVNDAVRLAGVYSHLPFDSAEGQHQARERSLGFQALLQELHRAGTPVEVSQLWGTAGVRNGLEDVSNAVCVGQLLYGLGAETFTAGAPTASIEPVLRAVRTQLVQVRENGFAQIAPMGGYTRGHSARMGVIPLGTSDGLRMIIVDRGAHVLVRGFTAPVLGVSLEHCVIDLSDISAQVGDVVTLIGDDGDSAISHATWSNWLGCSPVETATSFMGRLPKVYTA